MRGRLFLLAFFVILLSFSVLAQEALVTNSRDWKDVYSVEIYGNLMDINTMFVTGTRQATILHFSLAQSDIEVISSADQPYVVAYDQMLIGQGLERVSENAFDNVNLEMARRLSGVNKFIVTDDSYGYNALAIAPYASMAEYYVLFADDRNIGDVGDYLLGVDVEDIIIYGQVDREVKAELEQYNPETINLGDRFDNNIEIVKKFLELKPTKQVILTNGEFIEQSIVDGFDPVLFIGRSNVPDTIKEFIQESDIDIGILVGNELIGTATVIRRQVGISVFVKFAQGARAPGGAISAVEDLDRFPMPKYELDLSIFSVFYNQATGFLEVTYRNNVEIATYFKSTINIFSGASVQAVGDEGPIFIDGEEFKTILYEIDIIEEQNSTAEFFTIFGESKKSLEFALQGTFPIESISVFDDAMINITDLYYDSNDNAFYVIVKNIGEVDVYVDVELLDLWVNGEILTVGGDELILIKPGKTGKIKVSIELSEEDMSHRTNEEIDVKALYGQRENALTKVMRKAFLFKEKKGDIWTYILIVVVVILLLLIIFKRKKKCKHCKHKNPRRRDHCEKCGARL